MTNDGRFTKMKVWADEAQRYATTGGRDLPPQLVQGVIEALPRGEIRTAVVSGKQDQRGRNLIEFTINGPDAKPHTRRMLPVHFAIAAVLDNLPGVRVALRQGGDAGASLDDEGARLYLKVDISQDGGRARPTNLGRILFGLDAGEQLREKKGSDHHFIVPDTYRARRQLVRGDVADHANATTPEDDVGLLLRRLFLLADKMHGHELSRWE